MIQHKAQKYFGKKRVVVSQNLADIRSWTESRRMDGHLFKKRKDGGQDMVVCASDVRTQETEAGNGFLLEANLVFIASSRLVGKGYIVRLCLKK